MRKKNYTLLRNCKVEGCNEWTSYSYDTMKEYNEGAKRHKEWTCLHHRNPEKILSTEMVLISTEVIVQKGRRDEDGQYFTFPSGDQNGVLSGHNFRAWAKDFPIGTIIRITAEVELPNEL